MLTLTFMEARKQGACIESYRKFAKFKGGVAKWGIDKPFPLLEVLEVCGLENALWALPYCEPEAERGITSLFFACDCAEHVLPYFEEKYPEDKRPRQAIESARRFANGEAIAEELDAATAAAWDARDAEREWQKEKFMELIKGG